MNEISMIGKEQELFVFMKSSGYPIFHQSNLFLRDVEYGIRDYCRVKQKKDIGARESIRLSTEFMKDLEARKVIQPLSHNTWLLNMPQFLNKPKDVKEKKEAAPVA